MKRGEWSSIIVSIDINYDLCGIKVFPIFKSDF